MPHNNSNGLFTLLETETDTDKEGTKPMGICACLSPNTDSRWPSAQNFEEIIYSKPFCVVSPRSRFGTFHFNHQQEAVSQIKSPFSFSTFVQKQSHLIWQLGLPASNTIQPYFCRDALSQASLKHN